ncbi:hypothetical protein SDC9_83441 [bioreactor metagenome]|uniref:Uncharacterized protein n=1 Tax=bioreactor metagenome TaxID=1076179 RepID=A0A644Z866_9ZZZZ
MFLRIEIHYYSTNDYNKYSCQNNQARINEEHEVRDLIPVLRTERFVYVYKD